MRTIFCLSFLVTTPAVLGQEEPLPDGREGRDLLLRLYRPESTLKVDEHHLTRAKFPVVDVHTHFRYRLRHSKEQLEAFVKLMDRHNIAVCVSLDGKLGGDLDEHIKYLWTDYRDRCQSLQKSRL